jgi:hypothetical protein
MLGNQTEDMDQVETPTYIIKGHQDSALPLQALTREALLNVEVDKMAGTYWIKLVENSQTMPQPETHEIHEEEWQL